MSLKSILLLTLLALKIFSWPWDPKCGTDCVWCDNEYASTKKPFCVWCKTHFIKNGACTGKVAPKMNCAGFNDEKCADCEIGHMAYWVDYTDDPESLRYAAKCVKAADDPFMVAHPNCVKGLTYEKIN